MKPPVCSPVLRLIAMWLACHGDLSAAAPPDGGSDLLPEDWQGSATAQGGVGLWESARREFPGKGPGWQVRVIDETAHPSRLQLTCRLSGEAKHGDRLLVAFDARCVPGSSADGLAQAKVVIEIKEAPKYPKLGTDTWEGTGYKPELALWRKAWSEKPNAKVWRDLVWNQWATRASGKTDGQGCFNSRGHRGLYDIMIEHAGQERVLPFHTERGTDTLRVVW